MRNISLHHLPALSENSLLRLITVAAMYFAQGIQSGLLFTAIPAYMAQQGLEASVIGGFIGVLLLPWSLKIISAPVMDRFSFLPMGRRRPWVIVGMLGALLGYVAMGLVKDPLNNLSVLMAAGLVVSIATAFMDVAIDGLAVDIIEDNEYSKANAYMTGGNVIGFATTTAIASILMSYYGFSMTMFLIAFTVGVLALFPILLRERKEERFFPWSKGQASEVSLQIQTNSWGEIIKNLFKVIFLPSSITLALICFLHGITAGLFQTYLPVLAVQELAWLDTSYSGLVASAGLAAGISGMFIASPILDRWGLIRGVKFFALSMMGLGIGMGLCSFLWGETWMIQAFIFSYYMLRTLLLIALFTACMLICWKPVAATQFAIYMSISNVGLSLGASIYAPLNTWFSFPQIFYVFSFVFVLMLIFLRKIEFEEKTSHILK